MDGNLATIGTPPSILAPEEVLDGCRPAPNPMGWELALDLNAHHGGASGMAAQGLPVLALAGDQMPPGTPGLNRAAVEGLTSLGLQAIIDAGPSEVIAAVRACQQAAIQVEVRGMARSEKARPAWYVALAAFGVLMAASALVVWQEGDTLLDWIVRDLALLGYLAIFLAVISSHFKRQVTKIFGRSFVYAHHVVSVAGAVLLTLHPIGVAWRVLSVGVFVPVVFPLDDLLRNGGRIAWYIFALAALAAVWRRRIGRRWRTIHAFNYLAFVFGTVHANLLRADFQNLPLRIVSIAMLLLVAILFVRERIERRRRRAQIEAKIAAAERAKRQNG